MSNLEKPFELAPLTSKQLHASRSVQEAYNDFWNDIKFRKNWESPFSPLSELSPLLAKAAQIVVRIRSYLDEKDPTFKLRMTDGSAREYLWGLQHHEDTEPLKDPDHFVRQMVHATFRDANGYVEGLSEQQINEFIQLIQEYNDKVSTRESIITKLHASWTITKYLMKQLLSMEQFSIEGEEFGEDKSLALNSILGNLANVNRAVENIIKEDATKLVENDNKERQVESHMENLNDNYKQNNEENKEAQKEENKQVLNESVQQSTEHRESTEQKESQQKMKEEEASQLPTEEEKKEEFKEQPLQQNEEIKNSSAEESTSEDRNVQSQQTNPDSTDSEKKDFLKIQVIADEVGQLKSEIKSLQDAADKLRYEELAHNPEGKQIVEQLQKKCLRFSEGLMKDLLTLDSIVTSQQVRPLRKAQVTSIQQMIEEVDAVTIKLRGFSETLRAEEAKNNIEEEDRRQIDQEKKKKEEEQMVEESRIQVSHDPEDSSQPNWESLKLVPKMEVSETPRYYLVASYIPGMSEEDISIQISKNKKTLTIEGVRAPTPQEEQILRNTIRKKHPGIGLEVENHLLLKAGSGRWGKFSESYQLPDHTDPESISAKYERGVLRVYVPKVAKQPIHRQMHQHQLPHSFANDRDFWW